MFSNLRKRNNSGIVLVTVLMMSVIMMILAIGIIGTNVSSVTSGQRQIDRIKSEQLAKGTFWISYSKLSATPTPDASTTSTSQTLDGKSFVATVSGPGAGIGGSTESRSVSVNY